MSRRQRYETNKTKEITCLVILAADAIDNIDAIGVAAKFRKNRMSIEFAKENGNTSKTKSIKVLWWMMNKKVQEVMNLVCEYKKNFDEQAQKQAA